MLLVATEGKGSFDRYSRSLAERIDVPVMWTDIYQTVARRFGVSALSTESWKAFFRVRDFISAVKDLGASHVHLTNHHLARYGPDLGVPYIVTVHDTIRFLDLKRPFTDPYAQIPNSRDRRNLLRDIDGIKRASHIIAVSKYTKQDLIEHCDIPEDKITVVYEAVDTNVFKPSKLRIVDDDYILFVSTEYPRKNLSTLLKAFAILKRDVQTKRLGMANLKLVKVGNPGGTDGGLRRESLRAVEKEGLENDVVFTDFVSEDELVSLYSHAKCLVMPSLYEGFGFPALEAMACGTPVIASNTTSLLEIVDGYGHLVDPTNAQEIALAIKRVVSSKTVNTRLRRLGKKRVTHFSWDKAAKETQGVYDFVERNSRY